jgi:hypothetical protein
MGAVTDDISQTPDCLVFQINALVGGIIQDCYQGRKIGMDI